MGLADYGGASNLLECVPTYIHKVRILLVCEMRAYMSRATLCTVNNHRLPLALRLLNCCGSLCVASFVTFTSVARPQVPSLNAANVYMMNRTAGVWAALGNTTRAAQLAQWAQQLQVGEPLSVGIDP